METERKSYPSDLTDAEWQLLEPFIPAPCPGGRPARYTRREIVNAILYVLRSGCAWRLLPHDFPAWESCLRLLFHRWQQQGRWEQIDAHLVQQARLRAGRDEHPSAAILDSQSVKTTEKGAEGL